MPDPAKPKSPRKKPSDSVAIRAIESIDKPLGFYVLALFIVETFLGTVLIFSHLSEDHQFWGMLAGVGMFFIVLLLVTVLTCFRPQYLVYDRDAHLLDREMTLFGSKSIRTGKIKALPAKERGQSRSQRGE